VLAKSNGRQTLSPFSFFHIGTFVSFFVVNPAGTKVYMSKSGGKDTISVERYYLCNRTATNTVISTVNVGDANNEILIKSERVYLPFWEKYTLCSVTHKQTTELLFSNP